MRGGGVYSSGDMAKVSRRKASKPRSSKLKDEASRTEEKLREEEEEEEEDEEEEVSSDEEEEEEKEKEDEEDEEDERRRQKLLEAISALGAKRRRPLGERSEAAAQMSEFTVNAEGEGGKIELSDLLGSMEETPGVSSRDKKQVKNLQQSKKTLESPLSRQESERIQRDVAFQKAATHVSRWQSLVQQNQRAEHLVFPLHQEPAGPRPVERLVTGWSARTPLEQEVFALLSANKQPLHDPVLTPAEEASVRAMSLEEAKIRRAELQKARALQSYYEAKARRERKIKSKKFHKVLNKAKRKDFLKQFEEMVKVDPAGALEELNKMEVARMQERMSLKHQNSGKWAKSKAIMAKYDQGARKAMQQQLEVNKDLTQKMAASLEEDQEDEDAAAGDGGEVLPDFVNEAEQGPDSSNPWMRGKLSQDPAEEEKRSGEDTAAAAAAETPAAGNPEEEEEEDEEEPEEEALLREFDRRRKRRQESDAAEAADDGEEMASEGGAPASDTEEAELSQFTHLYQEMADRRPEAGSPAQLEEGLTRIRTVEDVELIQLEEDTPPQHQPPPPPEAAPPSAPSPPPAVPKKSKKRKRGIELKEVLTKEAKVIRVPLAPTVEDGEDGEEKLDQRGLIREAFAGDDVISDFLKDKRKQEEAGKPAAVDLTLPGWGEWGGTGVAPSRRKRRKFKLRVPAPPPVPRKDQKLPATIISEKRNSSISLHQVASLPFPFTNHEQFEGAVRCPLGRTWNTERTVRKVTMPKVVTRLGAIIEPMAAEELGPGGKTQAPGGKKQAPGGKKQAPGGKTQAPGGKTQVPGGKKQAPGGKTQAPAGSNRGGGVSARRKKR